MNLYIPFSVFYIRVKLTIFKGICRIFVRLRTISGVFYIYKE